MHDDPLNRQNVKRGSELPQARINEREAKCALMLIAERENLRRRADALCNRNIAAMLGLSHSAIDQMSARYTWLHVNDPRET